jgi:phage-related minor tail protein
MNTSNDMARASERTRKQQRDFTVGWKGAFEQYADDANNAAKQAERIFSKLTQGLEDAFVNFAKTGKFAFKDLINTIVEELLRSQIRQLLAQTFNLGGGGSGGGNIFSSIGKLFGFADGGSIPLGRPVLVGERGPEVFVPSSNGTVVPNYALGSGQSVVYNINAVDAASFKAMIARDPSFIHAVATQGGRMLPQGRR